MKKFFKIIVAMLIVLIPSALFAADLDIICNENAKPTIIRNTNPLFNITNFSPGDGETKSISIVNLDPSNPCIIDLQGRGSSNILTDKINVLLDNQYISTLTDFIKGSRINLGTIQSNTNTTNQLTLYLDQNIGNTYSQNTANFDILINSQFTIISYNV